MEKNEKKGEDSIVLNSQALSFMNNAQRIHALGGHCPPVAPKVSASDIPDEEL